MKIIQIAKIGGGQDGAIWNGLLFRGLENGRIYVYDLRNLDPGLAGETPLAASAVFTLDRAADIVPHCNAVVFGRDYYAPDDEFPLLYSNIYNNYAGKEDPLTGVCCVYRLQRDGGSFKTTLVQLIRIGFTDSTELWRTPGEKPDIRPYGNFVVDQDNGLYYGFVMRDRTRTTRYFAFDLPDPQAGVPDVRFGVNTVTLEESDIRTYFDCPYHYGIQGACLEKGKIYSVEGFYNSTDYPAGIRVVDTVEKRQQVYQNLAEIGLPREPECIDFWNGICWYSDAHGNLFRIDFD